MSQLQVTEKERTLLIKLAVLIGIVYGAVFGAEKLSVDYNASVQAANSELKTELEGFISRLSEINEEELLQSQYVDNYNGYRDRNLIIGPDVVNDEERSAQIDEEQRLYILERLQQIKNERKFFDIDYNLSQPENLPASFSEFTAESDVAVRANTMNVRLDLLHSLDLLMLLNDFYDPVDNRFTPVKCSLRYIGPERESSELDSSLLVLNNNIESTCTLVWLSVYDPKLDTVLVQAGQQASSS